MRRIMALMLVIVMLNQSVSVFADASSIEDDAGNKIVEKETVEVTETETTSLSEVKKEGNTELSEASEEGNTELAGENEEETTGLAEGESTDQTQIYEEETTELTKESEEETTELTKESEEETTELTKESEEETTELTKESEEETTELTKENGKETAELAEAIELASEVDHVYNVSLPANTIAYLDPGNLSGKGQIFSEQYVVENYGNTDIAVKIRNINIQYNSAESLYEFSDDKITEEYSTVKKLNVNLVWKNETENMEKVLNVMEGSPDEDVLLLKAAEYDENNEFVELNQGSRGFFYFTGIMNSNSDIVWEDGDITVHFDYEIVYAGEDDSVVTNMEDDGETEQLETENIETEDTENENRESENTQPENIEIESTEIKSEEAESTEIESTETGNTETKKENDAQE